MADGQSLPGRLAELEREWPLFSLWFRPLDKYVERQQQDYGRTLDDVLESLVSPNNF
jgi:hypothetical protein